MLAGSATSTEAAPASESSSGADTSLTSRVEAVQASLPRATSSVHHRSADGGMTPVFEIVAATRAL